MGKTAKVFGNSLDILPSAYHHKLAQPLNLARIYLFSPYSEVSKALHMMSPPKLARAENWRNPLMLTACQLSRHMS